MLTNMELWICANDYVIEHGKDAPRIAAKRCDELLDTCDYEGARNHRVILLRINWLLEAKPGDQVN